MQFQISYDSGVNTAVVAVFLPAKEVSLALYLLKSVPCNYIEFVNRLVELRRVTCGNYYPSGRYLVQTEDLVLQELKHDRCQRFRYAVDLIEEQYALTNVGLLHRVVDVRDDLRHGIFRNLNVSADKVSLDDNRQTHRRLSGLVSHRVRDQVNACLLRDLIHDSSLADTGRSQQETRSLMLNADLILAELVLYQVSPYRVEDLLLSVFYGHKQKLLQHRIDKIYPKFFQLILYTISKTMSIEKINFVNVTYFY